MKHLLPLILTPIVSASEVSVADLTLDQNQSQEVLDWLISVYEVEAENAGQHNQTDSMWVGYFKDMKSQGAFATKQQWFIPAMGWSYMEFLEDTGSWWQSSLADWESKYKMGQIGGLRTTGGNTGCRTITGAPTTCTVLLPMLALDYGCWCHANAQDIFAGRGAPVDEFDNACKLLAQCMRCTKLDAIANSQVCDPGSQSYMTMNTMVGQGGEVQAECLDAVDDPNNDCAVHTCCCELEYTRRILELFLSEMRALNPVFKHDVFDPNDENNCGRANNGPVARECCGEYPHRRVYNSNIAGCCGNTKIYSLVDRVCCDDGTVAPSTAQCEARKKRKR